MNEKDTLHLIHMNDVEATPVEWLIEPYIPLGKITVIQGDPGEGKTSIILMIASWLSNGKRLPDDSNEYEPINIIYQTAEDGLADTVKPRLLAANADTKRIMVIDESKADLTMTDKRLELAIKESNAKLVILDPTQAYLGASVNINSANDVRSQLKPLAYLAEKYKCAFVLIAHMNKATGMSALYRSLGSIDFAAAARSVLLVSRVKDNPTIRVMAQIKSSLAPEGEPIAFEFNKNSGIKYIGKYTITVDELLNGTPRSTKTEMAEKLLTDMLADGVAKSSNFLKQQADYRNISFRTLTDAKKNLGITSFKQGNTWFWVLKKSTTQQSQ